MPTFYLLATRRGVRCSVRVRMKSHSSLFVCLFVCLSVCLIKVGISTDKTVYLKRSNAKRKKKKRKKRRKVIKMGVFPKQICKWFLPKTKESRRDKTFFLKTNMEREVCTTLEACSTGEVLCW